MLMLNKILNKINQNVVAPILKMFGNTLFKGVIVARYMYLLL